MLWKLNAKFVELDEIKQERLDALKAKVSDLEIWEGVEIRKSSYRTKFVNGALMSSPVFMGEYLIYKLGKWVYERMAYGDKKEEAIPLSPFPIDNPVVYHFHPMAFVKQMRRMSTVYRKGDKGALILELNFRLAGFGGMLPTEEFTELTEKGVKQFQTDYMKITPTGEVDSKTLDAIDEFNSKYNFLEGNIKCPNCTFGGFGNGKYSEQKGDLEIAERFRKYEYPGVHRSLILALKAILFYLDETNSKLGYSFSKISSGYRCWLNNAKHKRTSTNHMGKSLDLLFNKSSLKDIETIRDMILIPKIGAQLRWINDNKFSLEPSSKNYPTEFITTSWIHIDVRKFQLGYLDDSFFVKNITDATGHKIVSLIK